MWFSNCFHQFFTLFKLSDSFINSHSKDHHSPHYNYLNHFIHSTTLFTPCRSIALLPKRWPLLDWNRGLWHRKTIHMFLINTHVPGLPRGCWAPLYSTPLACDLVQWNSPPPTRNRTVPCPTRYSPFGFRVHS